MTEALRLQNAARNSMEWFEHVERYIRLEPEQFAYSLLTRSQRVSHENLRLRDRDYLEAWSAGSPRGRVRPRDRAAVPMFTPFSLRGHDGRRTASSFRRWTCTAPSTGRRTTSIWCISARARSAAPAWSSPR